MNTNEKARADGGAPTQAEEEKPLTGDLRPQTKHTTQTDAGQEKSAWSLEDEIRIIDALISRYDKKQYRRQPRSIRELIYNDGMRLVCSYPFSYDANQYARQALSRRLRT